MYGILYLVATPIGNLDDITIRAINTLKNVDVIAAEDTRHTLKLLNHFNISKPLISFYRHNEQIKSDSIINKLKNGENIALVSDAGTPAISDPGSVLVKDAIENNIKVISIPGPCAAITAITCSGMDTSEFSFIGFLPTNKKLRKEKFLNLSQETKTLIIYEAPHKINSTLNDILENLGDRKITICRELTKIHEEILRGNISDIIKLLTNPKGEFIIILEGDKSKPQEENDLCNLTLEEHYNFYKKTGLDKKEIIKQIAKDRKVPKNDIYKYFLNS